MLTLFPRPRRRPSTAEPPAPEPVASEADNEEPATAEFVAEQFPAETGESPRSPVAEDLSASEVQVAGGEQIPAEEHVATNEQGVTGESGVVESVAVVMPPLESSAAEPSSETETLTEVRPVDSVAPDPPEIEPSALDPVAPGAEVIQVPSGELPPEKEAAALPKSRRTWWSFWRRPTPVEVSSTAEKSAEFNERIAPHFSPNAESNAGGAAPSDFLTAEVKDQEPPQEGAAGVSCVESVAPDDFNIESPAEPTAGGLQQPEMQTIEQAASDLAESESAVEPVNPESGSVEPWSGEVLAAPDESELSRASNPTAEFPVIEEPPTQETSALGAALTEIAQTPSADDAPIAVTESQGAENPAPVSAVEDPVAIDESVASQNPSAEAETAEIGQMALRLKTGLVDSIHRAADEPPAVATSTDEVDAAEAGAESCSDNTSRLDAPKVADSAVLEPAANVEGEALENAAPDAEIPPPPDNDTPLLPQGMPADEIPLEPEEESSVRVSQAHQEPRAITRSGSSGVLDLTRVAEPEVMDDAEEVEAYASAAAKAWLDKIDNSFVEHAARLVKGRQRGRALDIGTGPGQIALKLARRLSLWKFIGVDRSQKMIEEALSYLATTAPVTGRLEFRVADGNRLDFPDATFDLVVCNSVLHHFAEPKNLLAELARVTKPRGAILLRDLRRPSRLKYPFHVRWHGRHYSGAMLKLYRDSVRAAYTIPELQRLLDASPLRGAQVFHHGSTHIGLERPYNW